MRSLLRGRPGPIVAVGVALIIYALAAIYTLASFAWGGFLREPIVLQTIGFGFAALCLLAGFALATLGGYRCCRSVSSR